MKLLLTIILLLGDLLTHAQSANDFYKRAVEKYKQADYAGAEIEYSRALDIRPYSAVLWNNRGVCKYKQLKYSEALKDYKRSLDLDPDYVHAYFNKGNCHLDLAEYKEALLAYDQVVKRDDKYKKIYVNRAKVFFHLNDYKSCLSDIDKGIAFTDKEESLRKLYFLKGEVYVKLADLEQAIQNYNKAIDIDPTYFEALVHRGQCLLKKKMHQEAIKDFTNSLQYDTKRTGEGYYYRGLARVDQIRAYNAEKTTRRNKKFVDDTQKLMLLACSDFEKAKSFRYRDAFSAIKEYCN